MVLVNYESVIPFFFQDLYGAFRVLGNVFVNG